MKSSKYNKKRNWLYLYIGMLIAPQVVLAESTVNLQLICQSIPAQKDQLCTAVTESPTGPFDDVVIYRKTSDGTLVLLGSHRQGVGTFIGLGFSQGGLYMWESWAEEGHPYFRFYRTKDYLSDGEATKNVGVISEYQFLHIEKFTDDGLLAYSLNEGAYEKCPKTRDLPASFIDKETKSKHCLKYLFLNKTKM